MAFSLRNLWNIPALLISLIIIAIAFIVFAINISTISLPPFQEERNIDFILDTVSIFKNQYGIPHIIAKNELDMFFAIGYAHAQDRLWQMDYRRRAAYGRLSEIFGNEAVDADKFMRALEIRQIANKNYQSAHKKSKSILDAYSNGVNSYIKNNKKRLPFEFGALDYFPDEWQPQDCIALLRYFGFELSKGFYTDLALGEIAEGIGLNKIDSLLAGWSSLAPHILDEIPSKFLSQPKKTTDSVKIDTTVKTSNTISKPLSEHIIKIRNGLGLDASSYGSSCWTIQKNDSTGRTAYLANDSHLPLTLPAYWYQLHSTCPSFNVVGLTLPGIPLFLSGRNDKIAFGVTNLMLDDVDFFLEKTDTSGTRYFLSGTNTTQKFSFILDTIKIKNDEEIVYYRRTSRRSQVISDLIFPELTRDIYSDKFDNGKQRFIKKYCITFSWIGKDISDEIYSLYLVNKAVGWKSFNDGTSRWGYPAFVFSYSDALGNIGVVSSGNVPIRGTSCIPYSLNPGWLAEYQWTGRQTLGALPKLLNPSKKYTVSANNKLLQVQPYYLTAYWEHPSRAMRIEELLSQSRFYNSYSVRDAQIMLTDVYSHFARSLIDTAMPVLVQYETVLDDRERQARNILKAWDGLMSANSPAAMIYSVFLDRVLFNTFSDELGSANYQKFLLNTALPIRKLSELLDGKQPEWFDNVSTKERETRSFILLKSFKDAVDVLSETFTSMNPSEWSYGEKHLIELSHPLGKNQFLKPALVQGNFPTGGDNTTIHNTEYKYLNSFNVSLGASMRFITEMNDTLVYTSIMGGASGENLSPNYSDQVQLWLNGGYVKLTISPIPSEGFTLRIKMKPKK